MKKTQTEKVKEFMQKHGGITSMDAYGFGCTRLAARIAEIERQGIKIKRDRVTKKNVTFVRYRMEAADVE